MQHPLLRLRCRALGSGEHPALALIGTEAQQGGNVSGCVEFGVVLDVEQFDVAFDGGGNHGLGDVFELARFLAAQRALANHMSIEMAAVCALYRQMRELIADQQRLHLAKFERL